MCSTETVLRWLKSGAARLVRTREKKHILLRPELERGRVVTTTGSSGADGRNRRWRGSGYEARREQRTRALGPWEP